MLFIIPIIVVYLNNADKRLHQTRRNTKALTTNLLAGEQLQFNSDLIQLTTGCNWHGPVR